MNKKKFLIGGLIFLIFIIVIVSIIILICNKKIENYNIIFDTAGGNLIKNQIVLKGQNVIKPNNPTKEGYIFVEWTLDGKSYDFNSKVNSDITLLAVWNIKEEKKQTFMVTFNSNNGDDIQEIIVDEGSKIDEPEKPEKENFTFDCWYIGDDKFDFESEINENIELIAKWKKVELEKFIVTFDTNGGSSIKKEEIIKGDKINQPSVPTKKYYKFVEWQLNGKTYNFNQNVNSNITLKAVWEEDLPTNLPVPKITIKKNLFNRIDTLNTNRCEYQIKLSNYKDYLYQKDDGSYSYFIDSFEITREDGVGLMIQRNIEESLIMDVKCGQKVNVHVDVIRKSQNGVNIEAKSSSNIITFDTKADLTPTLKLGQWMCKNKEFCDVLYVDDFYEYKLDIFESVGQNFYDGVVEIYEKNGNDYIYVGIALDESGLHVKIPPNTKKVYVARAYIENDILGKVYGNYSNEILIDTSKEVNN